MARWSSGWNTSATRNTSRGPTRPKARIRPQDRDNPYVDCIGREIAMTEVIVVIGAGSIGQAIARCVSAGKHVLLADLRQDNLDAAAKVMGDAGFEVSTTLVDVASRASVHALVEAAIAI